MSTQDMIKKSVLENFSSDLSMTRIIIAFCFMIVLAIYIFYIYRFTCKNSFYSRDFNKSIALMSVITGAIVLAIQSNLVISLGMVGALSIIRFRNAIKDSMDLVFLFWSISVGIICGAGLYSIALITSLVITILIFVLDYFPSPKAASLLILNCSGYDSFAQVEDILKAHQVTYKTKSQNLTTRGFDVIFEIKCKDEPSLIRDLSALSSVTAVSLLNHDGERRF